MRGEGRKKEQREEVEKWDRERNYLKINKEKWLKVTYSCFLPCYKICYQFR